MKVAVLGTGAVGGTIAALLARGGHAVEVVARGENLTALRSGGLHLEGPWGSFTAPVTASEALTRVPELAFVTTKAQDAEAVLQANAGPLAECTVVIVQNGLRAIETAERTLPNARVVGGLALFAASYPAPGRALVTTAGPTYLGSPDPQSQAAVRCAADVLSTVMPTEVLADFVGAQWTKLVVNEINALPAITGMSAQDVIANRGLRLLMTQSMREAVWCGRAAGVRFATVQGLGDRMLRLFVRMPRSAGQVLPALMARRMGATPNPGSTLQSIRHGRLTEIDFLNGAVVAAGERSGVRTPVNRLLVRLVHEVESSGAFLTPAEVLSRERAAR